MWKQRVMWVLWPAFLAAGVMEMLVFAAFDPLDMHWLARWPELSPEFLRTAVYTASFFVFWLLFSAAGALTVLLAMPRYEVNDTLQPPGQGLRRAQVLERMSACHPNSP